MKDLNHPDLFTHLPYLFLEKGELVFKELKFFSDWLKWKPLKI